MSRRSIHSKGSKYRQTTIKANSGSMTVGLFLVLIMVIGLVAYLMIRINKQKSGDTFLAGSVELAPSTKPNILAKFFGKKPAVTVVTSPSPAILVVPTLVPRPLPKGLQEYGISLAKDFVGPKFVKATVSDYSTAKNVKQTVVIYIDKTTPADQVTGLLTTDTKQTPLSFSLAGDDGKHQKWQANWFLDDSVNLNFSFTFNAIGASGQSKTAVGER